VYSFVRPNPRGEARPRSDDDDDDDDDGRIGTDSNPTRGIEDAPPLFFTKKVAAWILSVRRFINRRREESFRAQGKINKIKVRTVGTQ